MPWCSVIDSSVNTRTRECSTAEYLQTITRSQLKRILKAKANLLGVSEITNQRRSIRVAQESGYQG